LPQAFPPLPHWLVFWLVPIGTQVLPLQHPPEHEVVVHWHWVPSLEQARLFFVQSVQSAPALPHDTSAAAVTHTPALVQQPSLHEVASQTHTPAALHSWPAAHPTHAFPPAPQAVVDDVTHAPVESQHPFGHVVGLHAHCPPVQLCPSPQTCPHDPQLLLSVAVSTSQPALSALPGQCAYGAVHANEQTGTLPASAPASPASMHDGVPFAVPQRYPQVPQFVGVTMFVSQPFVALLSQSAKPGSQLMSVHVPPAQTGCPFVALHLCAHAPQFCGSLPV
jgi:hypothetical protein